MSDRGLCPPKREELPHVRRESVPCAVIRGCAPKAPPEPEDAPSLEIERSTRPPRPNACAKEGAEDACPDGLLRFKKWWYRREVCLAVEGDHITGTPIFIAGSTLRVVNPDYSYFIPMHKVDYIRTDDGYASNR